MRIVAGEYRGRVLKAPKGEGTRPTTDRVREALMSALVSARGSFEGAVVLDAFAGSGALGFEALSRGAANALMYETDSAAVKVITANAEALKLATTRPARWRLSRADVLKHPPVHVAQPFDIVFLDPPYALDAKDVAQFVSTLEAAGALADGAVISYEYARHTQDAALQAFAAIQWEAVTQKSYGDTGVALFMKTEAM